MPDAAEQGREDDLVFPPEDLSSMIELARFIQIRQEPGLLVGAEAIRWRSPGRWTACSGSRSRSCGSTTSSTTEPGDTPWDSTILTGRWSVLIERPTLSDVLAPMASSARVEVR